MTALIENYLNTWNETDPEARRSLIEEHWSAEPLYVDPLVVARGRDQLEATIEAVQTQFPGFVFSRVGDVDAHHDQARFRWGLGPVDADPQAEPLVIGFDVVVVDPDGRIDSVHGFLDKVPS
ncbi:nuclear transport factor 2 family protein [Nocardioides sp. W7]|uniref:nuclear transport factor 2 family protein n=1 Tax=Nocardioides sp. W7 TaxID=2931390 RepID=UPI001FD1F509|nr:nuclear transport factor 2 family protein [Nocardioides sp. W7]